MFYTSTFLGSVRMKYLGVLVALAFLPLFAEFANVTPSAVEKCDDFSIERSSPNFPTEDCVFAKEGEEYFIKCLVRMFAEVTVQMNNTEVPPDNEKEVEERNVTVYVDFGYKFGLFKTEKMNGGEGEVDRCLQVIAISYDKKMEKGSEKRFNFQFARNIFHVIANAEMLSSQVELSTPFFVGKASIDSSCFKPEKRDYSSCIFDINISVPPETESKTQDGIVDFDVHTFGYSHLETPIVDEFGDIDGQQEIISFPDNTRKGRSLLKNLPGEKIKELRLPRNSWTKIDDSDLPNKMPNLEILDLSKTSIEELPNVLKGASHLKEVYLSESRLTNIPGFIKNQKNLLVLHLGGNPFMHDPDSDSEVWRNGLSDLHEMEVLNISNILKRYFTKSTLPNIPNLKTLYASYCQMVNLEEDSFVNIPSIITIDLSHNLLSSLPDNIFSKLKHLQYVDLSHNKIREGQGFLFLNNKDWPIAGMQLLDLSSNFMISAKNLIANESQVKRINLSNNALLSLDDMELTSYSYYKVKELDLSSNSIHSLSELACKDISYLQRVNLKDNQFDCSHCDIITFQTWMNSSGKYILVSPEDLTCSTPAASRKMNVKVYNAIPDEACLLSTHILFLLKMVVCLLLLAVLSHYIYWNYEVILCYLYCIKIWRRSAKGRDLYKECIYDVYVAYSEHDEDWVLNVLQPGLEESDQKYKLYIHKSHEKPACDFNLGEFNTKKIQESMNKSRKTLIILSESFVENQFCLWEMEMADQKLCSDNSEIIFIEMELGNKMYLPRRLCYLMGKKTSLKWPLSPPKLNESKEEPKEIEFKTSPHKEESNDSDKSEEEFWNSLQEALGESLYHKETKMKNRIQK